MNEPLLSILIPAYSYPAGVARILGGLGQFDQALVEILIFDDSPDEAVGSVLRQDHQNEIHYRHNEPPLGAPSNWNALLDAAKGRYCLLIHHDELPLSPNFVSRILVKLKESATTDVLLLDCILIEPKNGRNRRHVPTWLRKWVVAHAPAYLLRRNVLGPVSVMVARRAIYPRFDSQLRWLVDVDIYLRLFQMRPQIATCADICVGSILGRTESITAKLGSAVARIADQERQYLLEKHGKLAYWCSRAPSRRPWLLLEQTAWLVMRVLLRAVDWIPPFPRSVAQAAVGRVYPAS